jgi:hypothetical protein
MSLVVATELGIAACFCTVNASRADVFTLTSPTLGYSIWHGNYEFAGQDPTFSGTVEISGLVPAITSADITVNNFNGGTLTFTDLVAAAQNGNDYDIQLFNTTSMYTLNLAINNPPLGLPLFNGPPATFDSANSELTLSSQSSFFVLAEDFSGDIGPDVIQATPIGATPLPATLPMFAGGLGLVSFLTRRKRNAANA